MNRLAQEAVVVGLTRRLHERGSWCGETHIQKSAFLLNGLFGVPFDFDFILYKHGPFSFELRDELSSMRADRLLERQPQLPPYGPRIFPTARGVELEQRFATTMAKYDAAVDWIADRVGDRGVVDLERLATALWVTQREGGETVEHRAEALTVVKPHISREDAVEAVQRIDTMQGEAAQLAAA